MMTDLKKATDSLRVALDGPDPPRIVIEITQYDRVHFKVFRELSGKTPAPTTSNSFTLNGVEFRRAT